MIELGLTIFSCWVLLFTGAILLGSMLIVADCIFSGIIKAITFCLN
jgi:hypothetical protein